MGEPRALRVTDALEDLVNQFSDPMSFFRELIQNAIDAGTQDIDVSVTYEPGKADDDGVMTIRVDDYGQGMDEEIIDKRLTRLFSSAKDGDRTKIGKFGIGFVSVFAIEPDAVCVDSSRGGQHWRVLFRADRTFSKIKRDTPVDGTKVSLLKTVAKEEFEAFASRAREVVRFWCRHTKTEIRFNDDPINEPFEIADCFASARLEEADTVVVVGHRTDDAFAGYYNRGLTLAETEPLVGNVTSKISSPHLEHTLTRDALIKDKAYQKVVAMAEKLIAEQLVPQVVDVLEQTLAELEGEDREVLAAKTRGMFSAVAGHLDWGRLNRRALENRRLFRRVTGGLCSLEEIVDSSNQGYVFSRGKIEAAVMLDRTVGPILHFIGGDDRHLLHTLLGAQSTKRRVAQETYVVSKPLEQGESAQYEPLERAVQRLLDGVGAKHSGVSTRHLDIPGNGIRNAVAITTVSPQEVALFEEVRQMSSGLFGKRRHLVLNADNGQVGWQRILSNTEPELAAYNLVRLFFLWDGELERDFDDKLLRNATELRWQRLNG